MQMKCLRCKIHWRLGYQGEEGTVAKLQVITQHGVGQMMGWFVVFLVLISLFFAGFSFKSLILYVILAGSSFGVTYLFLSNKWGLDGLFEELFKIVELFGFGVPHRLESKISYSSFFTDGGFRSLDEIPKPLEECVKKLIGNIIRDFIRTWYENVGEGEYFISETRESLEMLCLEGYRRASQIDSHYLIEQVIVVFHGHLERFNKAMAIVKGKRS
ncbi:Sorting nexin-19 [Desmophyllum pertusum]|uniref:Sorting nexin-19 n=1 Tax=Desmophyllum pertusum TaxID=174260 RepID=A0A9X0CD32_9CNID|nr:Sorting nexin-19 [Desmophyllum pertusum]